MLILWAQEAAWLELYQFSKPPDQELEAAMNGGQYLGYFTLLGYKKSRIAPTQSFKRTPFQNSIMGG